MQGVITHVSDPNCITACTTALKNTPKTCGLAPFHLSILAIHVQLFRDFKGSLPPPANCYPPLSRTARGI